MGNIVDTFFKVCFEKFNFLVTEFGCRRAVREETGLCQVIYRNKTTAVEIGFEWREQYIYVELYRLVKGKIKENPIMIRPESNLRVFNLEDLLAIRAPELAFSSNPPSKPLSNNDVEKILTDRALALHKYARDISRGDFSVFRELDGIVKRRVLVKGEQATESEQAYAHGRSDAAIKRLEHQSSDETVVDSAKASERIYH
jgi:hypothetical protein